MQHRDRMILQKILEVIAETTEILQNVSEKEFLQNKTLKLAMGMSIIRVGELVKNLNFEVRKENPQISWRDIAGFRDVAAHKYDILDFQRVYMTIKKEFPELKTQIEKILEDE